MQATIHNLFQEQVIMPNNLDAVIRASGMTKKQVANAAGIMPETLSRHIHGHVQMTLENAEKYAEILGVTVQKIMFVHPPTPIIGRCNYKKDETIERVYYKPDSWKKGLQIKAFLGDDLCAVHWTCNDDYTGDFIEYKNAFNFFLKTPILENKVHCGCVENVSLIKLKHPFQLPNQDPMQILGGVLYPEPGKRYTLHSGKLGIHLKNLEIEWATPLVSALFRPDLRGVTFVDMES